MLRPRRLWRLAKRAVLAPGFGAVTRVKTQLPLVALTFDDGPSPVATRELLAVLARHGAQATHFLVGEAAEARPDLVAALVEAGNAVGSHTYSHRSLVRLPKAARESEIVRGAEALGQYATKLFRPPYGHYDIAVARDLRAVGLTCIAWSAHVEDWILQDAKTIAARLRKALAPGAIILLHEALYTSTDSAAEDRGPLLEALDFVLGEFSSRYRFGTVPELLAAGKPVLQFVEKRGEDSFIAAQRPGSVQETLRS